MTTSVHPRRRPASPCSIEGLSDSMNSISLRKGSTFQVSPSSENNLLDPFLRGLPSLPSRSATCPKALEDLLIGAGERRAAELLQRVDDAIATRAELSTILSEPEVLPVPRFMIENATAPDVATDTNVTCTLQHQDRDSGIGSSIISTAEKRSKVAANNNTTIAPSVTGTSAGIQHCLSEFAQQQIHKFLVQPILREDSLKEFHPLIRDVPRKIGSKDIRTVRDLEKTLIFLAPDFSKSLSAYRSFCNTTIQCLHLTVNGIHESDRCLPQDRPYSTNYFIDLVEQIKRYAAILAATRAKEARGEKLTEMDARPTDKVELVGGMSHSGKPAFLARRRDDKYLSLADGKDVPCDEATVSSSKRAMDVTENDDGIRRSMARRKKNEPPPTYYCDHSDCGKQFSRRCDLKKHLQNVHVRPHKCPVEECMYHTKGYGTAKECERHYNDVHNDAPELFPCTFPGCNHMSKRESNLKDHQEKQHSITYFRTKGNKKGSSTPETKTVTNPSTKRSKASGKVPSKTRSKASGVRKAGRTESTSMSSSLDSPSTESSYSNDVAATSRTPLPAGAFDFNPDFFSHFNTDYLNPSPLTSAFTDDRRTSAATSVTDYSPFDMPMNSFDDPMVKSEEWDFGALGNNGYDHFDSGNAVAGPSNQFDAVGQDAAGSTDLINFSPGAQDYIIGSNLFDAMAIEQGFEGDFQLYQNCSDNSTNNGTTFQDSVGLGGMGSQFSSSSQSQLVFELFPELAGQQ